MPLVRLDIRHRSPYCDGKQFGDVGAYERIDAWAHYEVDPAHPANDGIVDLKRAPRNGAGKVEFGGDVTILRPVDSAKANGGLLLEAPNRGYRIALRAINMAPAEVAATARMDPGDGFLFAHGWTVAWCGWQWDVPRSDGRIGLEPPQVTDWDDTEPGHMQLRVQPNQDCATLVLTDQHVGAIGHHEPIAPGSSNANTTLWVRDSPYGDATQVPRATWRFCNEQSDPQGELNAVTIDGGFKAGRVYDVVYRPAQCPVVGAGLLALRDCAVFLRGDPSSPVSDTTRYVIGEGQSQCGRLLRTFLHAGLNADEDDTKAFDGLLIHIAGGRRGEFNHRYGQPSVQPTPSFGHLFPFTDSAQRDPQTDRTAGLLDMQSQRGHLPKVIYTDTSSEYWRGDAGLTHLDLQTRTDVEPPAYVRRYLFAGTQHGPGAIALTSKSHFGSQGANSFNAIDYRPLYRGVLMRLLDWVSGAQMPPENQFPRISDGTAAPRRAVLSKLASTGLTLPDEALLTAMYPLDLGPGAGAGVGQFPARVVGPNYPDYVSDVDDDGNERAGVKMPDVAVPLGTHSGFNSRHANTGGQGQLLEYLGSTAPFAKTETDRAPGDTRQALATRYRDANAYLSEVRSAAHSLSADGFLEVDDIEVCVELARQRYQAWFGPT
ncbi:MAG: hypothetical protein K0U93_30600 [Gammaproteobacteria bacterium]|nr:hypothetical protein [Gammaproteobacteria bacterium]